MTTSGEAGSGRTTNDGDLGGRWPSVLAGTAVSAVILALLILQLDAAVWRDGWSRLQPGYGVAVFLLFGAVVAVRGLRLRKLAGRPYESGDRLPWIRLAAVHQLVFTVLPSALGDLSFPALVKRVIGGDIALGTRLLLAHRLQDLWALTMLAGLGLLAQVGFHPWFVAVGLSMALACLVWSADLTRHALAVPTRLGAVLGGRRWKFLQRRLEPLLNALLLEASKPVDWPLRLYSAAATIAAWTLATVSLWCLFAMFGIHLSFGQALLVIAGLNLVGAAAAFTVAGLGVSEVGLAGILLALGFALPEALATALIVRPAALIMTLASCGLIEIVLRFALSPPRPIGSGLDSETKTE